MNNPLPSTLPTDTRLDSLELALESDEITMFTVESRNMPDAGGGCTTTTDLELVAAPPGMCCCCSCCG